MVSLLAPGEKMAEVLNRTRTEAKARVSKVSYYNNRVDVRGRKYVFGPTQAYEF